MLSSCDTIYNSSSAHRFHRMSDRNLNISMLLKLFCFVVLFMTGHCSFAAPATLVTPGRTQNAVEMNVAQNMLQRELVADSVAKMKNFYMDLRSNMLYDVAALPNIGAEFYVGRQISVLANWMYGWWNSESRHRYWRAYGGDLGARWWFGQKNGGRLLTGHHVGIYFGALIFDFEWGGTGYMGGKPGGTLWDRCLVNTGIEYGYSLPVGKHLNIDFSIGLGYLGGKYIKYFPLNNEYYREKEYNLRFFGPTKAEVSLVWFLEFGNNSKKGGNK
ncbi:MAG: DUF3575 domain-containing protein [Muribaculaceae bacterium]|nr:DUF3575 domain-containing protein [Muribaculaceae bacterium]